MKESTSDHHITRIRSFVPTRSRLNLVHYYYYTSIYTFQYYQLQTCCLILELVCIFLLLLLSRVILMSGHRVYLLLISHLLHLLIELDFDIQIACKRSNVKIVLLVNIVVSVVRGYKIVIGFMVFQLARFLKDVCI